MPIQNPRLSVVLNAGSGDGAADAAEAILGPLFSAAGFDVRITMLRGDDDLAHAMTAAIADGVQIVAAGGGDGTINAVVNAIAGHDITLGVLPLGTLNHFAKDLGIPIALEDAARVIIAGHTSHVDVGEVNGRAFLNNSSLGLYPRIVQLRERYRARGIRKWFVATWATLVVYVVKHGDRVRLLQLVWRILTGTARASGDLAMVEAQTATIDLATTGGPTEVPVAIDGELATMTLPLRYVIRPAALRVIVPA